AHGVSWLALPRRVAANERKFDKRTSVESEGSENSIDGEVLDSNIDGSRRTAGVRYPVEAHIFRLQIGYDGCRIGIGLNVTVDNHISNRGVTALHIARARAAISPLRRVARSVPDSGDQLVVNIKRIAELEGAGEEGDHDARGDGEFHHRVALLRAGSELH